MSKCKDCNMNPLLCPYDADCPAPEHMQIYKLVDKHRAALELLEETAKMFGVVDDYFTSDSFVRLSRRIKEFLADGRSK